MKDNDVNKIRDIIPDIIIHQAENELRKIIKESHKPRMKQMKQIKKMQSELSDHIISHWMVPINLMDIFWLKNVEVTKLYSDKVYKKAETDRNLNYLALTHIHARSMNVSYEIITLLKNGCPDGAIARWRTLYELSIIARLIEQKRMDSGERYLNHIPFQRLKSLRVLLKHQDVVLSDKISEEEFKLLEAQCKEIVRTHSYEDNFENGYGWASKFVYKKDGQAMNNPQLVDLEREVKLSHYRPYYDYASIYVHAHSKSMVVRSGSPSYTGSPPTVGLVDSGLALPMQLTAIILNSITNSFINIYFTESNEIKNDLETLHKIVLNLKINLLLIKEIESSAIEVEQALKAQESSLIEYM